MSAARVPLSRQTKAMLVRRVRVLTRALQQELDAHNALVDETAYYTADEDIPKGTTIRVRVPRRFLPR